MAISINKTTLTDIPDIITLGKATPELHITENSHIYYSADELASLITSPHDIYLTAKIDGQFAGYQIGSFNHYLKEAYLIDLSVKPEFRQQGVGKALMQATLSQLDQQGCGWIWCLVHEHNQYIIKLMDNWNFTQGRKFYFYYKSPPYTI